MRRLTGKTAIVTGGSRGASAAPSSNVPDRERAGACYCAPSARSADADGTNLIFVAADVACAGNAEAIVAEALDRFGGLDILVE